MNRDRCSRTLRERGSNELPRSDAAEAEFRTHSGPWARVGGLLLIVVGVLGMVLLLGSFGLRLLMAAMLSLFYLLLTPGIVLAPAIGERGRAVFGAWAARLFGAVISKLVFAFLLGVVLAVMEVSSRWPVLAGGRNGC